jgi:hypothetical protein
VASQKLNNHVQTNLKFKTMLKDTKPTHNATKPMLALGRLTYKKLIIWLNEKFKKLEIKNYVVTEIARTYYTMNDYECGACKLMIYFENKQLDKSHILHKSYFMCFYTIGQLQWFLENGYELCLTDKNRDGIIKNFELDVRKT